MLKKLAKRVEKELAQAADYCEQAMIVKQKSPQTADLFATLSGEEIEHAEKLLREGKRLIEDKHLDSYSDEASHDDKWHEKCKNVWEWEHRLAADEIAEIKYKLQVYRGM